jgi:threonine synthase
MKPVIDIAAKTSFFKGLVCKECGCQAGKKPLAVCPECFGPLEADYDYAAMKGKVTRASIEAGPRNLWRYRDLLPVDGDPRCGQHSGFTPLKRADRLAKHLGLKELYIKDDSANYPTWSYKERVVSVAITKAAEFGFTTVACASTGNLANSVAAHAAASGIDCVVLIPHDLEKGKVLGSLVFGPRVVRIKGNYDDVNRLCCEIADAYGWAIVNVNLRPYYTEGAKTFGYEIAEQLGWKLPQHTISPVAGGTILPKIHKAYQELVTLGIVEDNGYKIHAAQAAGCDPVAQAVYRGDDDIVPQKPNTIARSIAIGNPADGYRVCHSIAQTGGWAASASDQEIVDAIQLLAKYEGVWTEPAGGTTLACTIKLLNQGKINPDESIVVSITGNGLKTHEAIEDRLDVPDAIDASLSSFDELLKK